MLIYTNDVAGKQAKMIDQSRSVLNSTAQQIKVVFENLKNQVWTNADGLTPQQAMDAWGTNFAQLEQMKALSANFINTMMGPGTVSTAPPDGHTYVVNQDGTGTVTA